MVTITHSCLRRNLLLAEAEEELPQMVGRDRTGSSAAMWAVQGLHTVWVWQPWELRHFWSLRSKWDHVNKALCCFLTVFFLSFYWEPFQGYWSFQYPWNVTHQPTMVSWLELYFRHIYLLKQLRAIILLQHHYRMEFHNETNSEGR